jgi:signal transduction histidine kinase
MSALADENRDLRRSLRDLVALTALPAAWLGRDPQSVASSAAEVLLRTLLLDLVTIYLRPGPDQEPREVVHLERLPEQAAWVAQIRVQLAPYPPHAGVGPFMTQPELIEHGEMRIAIIPIGYDGACGVIAAGAQRADFPNEQERLLFNVGINQLALAVDNARLNHEAQQAAQLAQSQARQLLGLATAALAINASPSLELMLQHITDQGRAVIMARYARTSLALNHGWVAAAGELPDMPAAAELAARICGANRPLRLSAAELAARHGADEPAKAAPCGGWLAVPLIGRDGQNLGLIQVVDKLEGDFNEADEAILVQLAQVAAVGIENIRLYQEVQDALRTREEFLAIAAHELKTPITSMLSYTQLIMRRAERKPDADPALQRSLQALSGQIRRLNRMVFALLDLSRIQSGQLLLERQLVDLQTLLDGVVEELRPTLTDHTLRFEDSDEPLIIEGDDLRLEQVFFNLLSNAIKYSPSGGLVTLQVRRVGKQIEVVVADQGIGIPAAAIPQLFERFFRVQNNATDQIAGMGLGLYVVREIVSLHGGTVSVASEEGAGTSFTVSLPLYQG